MFDGNLPLSELIDQITTRANDPAMLGALKSSPEFMGLCHFLVAETAKRQRAAPMPPISAMNAIQVAIFDNWPGGIRAKHKPNRYGAAVEVWTDEPGKIRIPKVGSHQHKANIALLSGPEMVKRAASLLIKKTIGAEYAEIINSIAMDLQPGDLMGLMSSSEGGGTNYHPFQFAIVHGGVRGVGTDMKLIIGETVHQLSRFSDQTPSGGALPGKAVLQSRNDLAGFTDTWATKPW